MARSWLLWLLVWPLWVSAQENDIRVQDMGDGVKRYYNPNSEDSRFIRFIEQKWSVLVGAPPFGRSVAFLVGVSDYRHLPDLPSVRSDLDKMRTFLLQRAYFDEVYQVRDGAVNRDLIETYMTNVLRKMNEEDRLFFYYSGHGGDDLGRVGYMLFAGAKKGRFYGDQVLKLREVHDWMNTLRVRHQLYLLDCCASGLTLQDKGIPDGCDDKVLATLSGIGSRTILTAGAGDQRTYAQSDKFGLFTRSFLDAFETDPTRGRCSLTTADEVFGSMQQRMAQFTAGKPVFVTPRIWQSNAPQHAGSFVFLHDQSGVRFSDEERARLQLKEKGEPVLMGRVRVVTFKAGRLLINGEDRGLLPKGGTWEGNLAVGSHTATIVTDSERIQKAFSLGPGDFQDVSLALGHAQSTVHPEDPEPNMVRAFPIAEGVSVEMVWLEGGTFTMGSNDPGDFEDETPHQVRLSKGFWLGITEVSQAQWQAVMGDNLSRFKGDDLPVERVSWDDAQAFIKKINARTSGAPFRLPTEAEWEYACRAGTQTPFAFGGRLTTDHANFNGNYPYGDSPKGVDRGKTVPVKSFEPNAWGLYQMHGNVWEWCADWYGPYPSSPVTDPRGPETGVLRVLRGGGWFDDGGSVRSAYRFQFWPGSRGDVIGFRLARDL